MNNLDRDGKNIYSIDGKIVAVIGAAGILGTQYVKYLSSLGAKVIIGDINFDQCIKLSEVITAEGNDSYPLRIDMTDEDSIVNFFSKIYEKYGYLDVLINNSQTKPRNFFDSFENYSKKTLIEVLDGNLIGVTIACREASKNFLKNKQGVIINVSSIYGVVGADQRIYEGLNNVQYPEEKFSLPVSYAISKAGVIQLTKYLASYYREKNIRVNCLTLGGVYNEHDTAFNKNYSYRTTLGRMAEKDEYNGTILFLCSDASSYMSGANIIVDGGWTAI